MKKSPEISFYTSVPKIMIICYTAPKILQKTAWKTKMFLKNEKNFLFSQFSFS